MDDDKIPLIGTAPPKTSGEEDVDKAEARARALAAEIRKLLPAEDDVMTLVVLAQLLGNTMAKQAFLGMSRENIRNAITRFNAMAFDYHQQALRALVLAAGRER